jgi:hypothetical protein
MMYLAQIGAVLYVTWASIHYEWTPNGYAVAVVAFFAALLVTAIIIEIKLLPSRFARLHQRIFGLKDEPGDEIPRLPRAFRHGRNALHDRGRLRIGKDSG